MVNGDSTGTALTTSGKESTNTRNEKARLKTGPIRYGG